MKAAPLGARIDFKVHKLDAKVQQKPLTTNKSVLKNRKGLLDAEVGEAGKEFSGIAGIDGAVNAAAACEG